MMKKNKALILSSLVCLIPIILSLIFYKKLPDQVATHWDFNGVANGFSSKFVASFGMPIFMLLINLVVHITLENDPKKKNYPNVFKNIGKWTIPVVSVLAQVAVIINAVVGNVNFFIYISLGIGILFTIIGNYMPKCRQNYTAGIRLPWTLNNEVNWNKTHRFAGFVWTAGGICIIINTFFRSEWVIFAVLGVLILSPMVYSFILHKNGNK